MISVHQLLYRLEIKPFIVLTLVLGLPLRVFKIASVTSWPFSRVNQLYSKKLHSDFISACQLCMFIEYCES